MTYVCSACVSRYVAYCRRFTQGAIKLANWAASAKPRPIPCFLDVERMRDGLLELLKSATYVNVSPGFLQSFLPGRETLQALAELLQMYTGLVFVTCTFGEKGSMLLRRRREDTATAAAQSLSELTQQWQVLLPCLKCRADTRRFSIRS